MSNLLSPNLKGVGAFVDGDERQLALLAEHGGRQVRRAAQRLIKRRAKAQRAKKREGK